MANPNIPLKERVKVRNVIILLALVAAAVTLVVVMGMKRHQMMRIEEEEAEIKREMKIAWERMMEFRQEYARYRMDGFKFKRYANNHRDEIKKKNLMKWHGLTKFSDQRKAMFHETFDKVFVVNHKKCQSRLHVMEAWESTRGVNFTTFQATEYSPINLHDPPKEMKYELEASEISTGQIAWTLTHRRLWREVLNKGYKRVIVLRDTGYLTDEAMTILPEVMKNIDEAATARKENWHYIFISRQKLKKDTEEEKWCRSPSFHPVTKASPSLGSGAYILSAEGAKFLLDQFQTYRLPLDEQLAALQHKKEFIALSACNNDVPTDGCPENVAPIASELHGECAGLADFEAGSKLSKADFQPRH